MAHKPIKKSFTKLVYLHILEQSLIDSRIKIKLQLIIMHDQIFEHLPIHVHVQEGLNILFSGSGIVGYFYK